MDNKSQDLNVNVRFQKKGGAVVCKSCGMYRGPAPTSNGYVNEFALRNNKLPCSNCGSIDVVLKDFHYSGKTIATVTTKSGRKYTGYAKLVAPDVFKRTVGYNLAIGKAISRYIKDTKAVDTTKKNKRNIIDEKTSEELAEQLNKLTDVIKNSKLMGTVNTVTIEDGTGKFIRLTAD